MLQPPFLCMIMDSSAGVCDILLGDHNQFYFFSLHFISFRFVASFHSFHSLVFSAHLQISLSAAFWEKSDHRILEMQLKTTRFLNDYSNLLLLQPIDSCFMSKSLGKENDTKQNKTKRIEKYTAHGQVAFI